MMDKPTGYATVRSTVHEAIAAGNFASALQIIETALSRFGVERDLLKDMMICHWRAGDTTTAIQLARATTETWPDDAEAWGRLGVLMMSMGAIDESRTALTKALDLAPTDAKSLCALNLIAPFPRDGRHARTLQRIATAKKTTRSDRLAVLNALGRIEDRAGRHAIALQNFKKSKSLTPGTYDAEAMTAFVDDQVGRFAPSAAASETPAGPRIVFVGGMPRSGTTLLDSMISRHSRARSVGESRALADTLRHARDELARRKGLKEAWGWVDALGEEDWSDLRARFMAAIAPEGPGDADVLVTKMPLDCLETGFASRLLPDARFIFMSRHPLDVGLSNLKQRYHIGNAFSKSLASTGHMITCVHRSLDDYAAKLGDRLRIQSFSELVREPEQQIGEILAHAGLEFEKVCLSPGARDGAIRTASVVQVRKGLNTDGLDTWRPYEQQLAPLVDALGGWDWIERWEARDGGKVLEAQI